MVPTCTEAMLPAPASTFAVMEPSLARRVVILTGGRDSAHDGLEGVGVGAPGGPTGVDVATGGGSEGAPVGDGAGVDVPGGSVPVAVAVGSGVEGAPVGDGVAVPGVVVGMGVNGVPVGESVGVTPPCTRSMRTAMSVATS